MANRYNAVIVNDVANIRPADHGISAIEWERGVRMLEHDFPSRVLLEGYARRKGYRVLSMDAWSEAIDALSDGTDVPNNTFKYPQKPDKWNTRSTIY